MNMQAVVGKTILRLLTGDIADQDTDAVVTAAHWRLNKGTGTDGTIHSGQARACLVARRDRPIQPKIPECERVNAAGGCSVKSTMCSVASRLFILLLGLGYALASEPTRQPEPVATPQVISL